jgi:hypothetical protein
MLEYWSMAGGFEPFFLDGMKHGASIVLVLSGIYNFKVRQHMPWNKKK